MKLEDFYKDVENCGKKLKLHEAFSSILRLMSLGIITNAKNIDKLKIKYEKSLADFYKYKELIEKSIELDQSLKTIIINSVRISKHTFFDMPVVDKADYGFNWENLREQILTRDNYECQESDEHCLGPLQIHHIVPLSKGGSNKMKNLKTLCFYHHSLKHHHMREKYYGNIWS
ncbi:HNH endonuclease [Acidobacteriota bacterium]